jgi:Cu(I)/Ag(I) efflux system protein CusF
MKFITTVLMSLSLMTALLPGANAAEKIAKTDGAADLKSTTAGALSSGEVKKIDKDASKITLKHGPLVNLGMPAMTMVFKVKSPGMLNSVKVGDAIKFRAENINGALTVTEIGPVKP